jgi:cobalt-zinc-cadmium efflux system outer membrane protein
LRTLRFAPPAVNSTQPNRTTTDPAKSPTETTMKFFLPLFLSLVLLVGCATPTGTAYRDTHADISAHTGYPVVHDPDIARTVCALLAHPLTADSAAQVALLNNAGLRADFKDIGIAQADWVEAGLLKNPELGFGLGFPLVAPEATRVTASFTQGFLDLLTLPRRKKIAADQLDAVRLRIADEALALVAETKDEFYVLQAQQQILDRLQNALDLEHASAELARLQHDAGNISDLALLQRQAAYDQLRLDGARAQAGLQIEREKLNRLLGLAEAPTNWRIDDALAPVPASEPPLDQLETIALDQRFDLAAAKADYAAAARGLGLAENYRFANSVDLGVGFERDVDQESLGPTIGVELPIFNHGAARKQRAKAQLRQAADRLEALAAVARSEVRVARDRLLAAHDAAILYRDTLGPEQRRLVELTQQHYNGMFASAYELVLAKQNELAAERGEIEARRDYWISLAELERAAGGSLTPTNSQPATQP